MGEKPQSAPGALVRRHLEALGRLPYGSLLFDRTSRIDLLLVEKGFPELADELALLEEEMGAAAEKGGEAARKPGGVARVLAAEPGLGERLRDLLARLLPPLGLPEPAELAGPVSVAVDLHVTPEQAGGLEIVRKGRLGAKLN